MLKPIFFILLISTSALSTANISGSNTLHLGSQLEYWIDESNSTTLTQILSSASGLAWITSDAHIPNFGFDDRTYWYRFRLPMHSFNQSNELLLEIPYPALDDVQLFGTNGNTELFHFVSGDKLRFQTRPVLHQSILFPIAPPSPETVYYLRVKTKGVHKLPLNLWHKDSFYANDQNYLVGTSLYFGIMLAMIIYNLFIYVSTKDKNYIFYVCSVMSFSLFQATLHGFSYRYLWPELPRLNDFALVIALSAFTAASSAFFISFLELKRNHPKYYKSLVTYCGACCLITIASPFLPYSFVLKLIIIVGLPFNILVIIIGIHCWLAGEKHARIFVAGWSTFLVALIIFTLGKTGILPSSFFVDHSVQVGSIVEVLLFSFALAEKINVIQEEKNKLASRITESLRENIKLKNTFLATISHELRTPMNGIIGCLENMKATKEIAEIPKLRNTAMNSAQHMVELVDNILAFSEMQSGQLTINTERFSTEKLVDRIASRFRSRFDEKGIKLFIQVDENTPNIIEADEYRVEQITSLLLDNALKFTPAGEVSLTIRSEEINASNSSDDKKALIVTVSDTGIGIDNDEKIYDMFYQVDSGYHRAYGGIGLGLTIASTLANKMGGSISLESKLGRGSTFTASIPISTPKHFTSKPLICKLGEKMLESKRILVVEDNDVNRLVIKSILNKLGANVLQAENGLEGVKIASTEKLDLILMDLQMPVMDGFESTRQIRQLNTSNKDVPIIAVTANVMSSDREECMKAGMNNYIAKPLTIDKLATCLS